MYTYQQACDKARQISKEQHCGQHVNAVLDIVVIPVTREERPVIVGFAVSDWFDGSTVASFTDGRSSK